MAGLIGKPIGIINTSLDTLADNYDDILEPGIYSLKGTSSSIPNSSAGIFIVIKDWINNIVQLKLNTNGNINIRVKLQGSTFNPWKTLIGQ